MIYKNELLGDLIFKKIDLVEKQHLEAQAEIHANKAYESYQSNGRPDPKTILSIRTGKTGELVLYENSPVLFKNQPTLECIKNGDDGWDLEMLDGTLIDVKCTWAGNNGYLLSVPYRYQCLKEDRGLDLNRLVFLFMRWDHGKYKEDFFNTRDERTMTIMGYLHYDEIYGIGGVGVPEKIKIKPGVFVDKIAVKVVDIMDKMKNIHSDVWKKAR